MLDFNHPTQTIIQLTIQHLTNLGHTNVKTTERWEKDDVHHVWSDQSTKEQDPDGTRYGWTLDVSGNDNPHYDPGITFSWTPRNHLEGQEIIVTSWSHLTQLINSH